MFQRKNAMPESILYIGLDKEDRDQWIIFFDLRVDLDVIIKLLLQTMLLQQEIGLQSFKLLGEESKTLARCFKIATQQPAELSQKFYGVTTLVPADIPLHRVKKVKDEVGIHICL